MQLEFSLSVCAEQSVPVVTSDTPAVPLLSCTELLLDEELSPADDSSVSTDSHKNC